jgi:hypothetical protein
VKIIILIITSLFFLSCDTDEFKSYYPAFPPYIELIHLAGGTYDGDYMLLFRSSNNKNSRFGGFLIFLNSNETNLLQMDTQGVASYTLGIANGESSSLYNPADGNDTQLAILFTNNSAPSNNILVYNSIIYTLAKILSPVSNLSSGNWMVMRAYLWDSTNDVILEVSEPGNPVTIP